MRRFAVYAITILSVLLGSCTTVGVEATSTQAQVATLALPIPKSTITPSPRPPTSTPLPPTLTPTSSETASPPASQTPTLAIPTQPIVQRESWPEPFTYGRPYPIPTAIPSPVEPYPFSSDVINVLLEGSDKRRSSTWRTDTLIILSIHPRARGAVLISIPRDLYVYLPGYTMQRINTAVVFGRLHHYPGRGQKMLEDAILYNLGIPIHYYARIDMSGFRRMIDAMGGIRVRVACKYTDWRLKEPDLVRKYPENWELYSVPRGVIDMDGDLALWYARSRLESSDFDRARRQQEVLNAIYRRILQLDLVPELPSLYRELTEMVATDMHLKDLLPLAPLAILIKPERIRHRFIGKTMVQPWKTPTGARVQLPKPEAIRKMLDQAFRFDKPDSPSPKSTVSIEIVNASGRPQWDALAKERLLYAGFHAEIGPQSLQTAPKTSLINFGQVSATIQQKVLTALRLSTSAVVHEPNPESDHSFRLILGEDYRPCFNPTRR